MDGISQFVTEDMPVRITMSLEQFQYMIPSVSMKYPDTDRQNAMDPSITFHDDLMNGESQIDIVSWMTFVSYLRLDSNHDWSVDNEEWEKGKNNGLIPDDFSTKDFSTLAG